MNSTKSLLLLFAGILHVTACSDGNSLEPFGDNPHPIASPKWQRFENCKESATLTETYANDVANFKGKSGANKKDAIIATMGREPFYEESVGDLLVQHQIKIALKNEGNGKAAFDEMWNYCMSFSVKQHYYKDDLINEVKSLDEPTGF